MNEKTVPCQTSFGDIIKCRRCHQPIMMNERMIDIDVHARYRMGSLDLIGGGNYHERCVEELLSDKTLCPWVSRAEEDRKFTGAST